MRIGHLLKHLVLYATLAFFTYLMIRITLPHFSMDSKEGFLRLKQTYLANKIWLTSFYIHVYTSVILLLAGFTQFSSFILSKHPKLHRKLGYTYLIVLLVFSAPAGFIMSIYANGGTYSKIAFLLLSILWILSSSMAWRTAIKRNFSAHEKWMIISYALTLSALTLRAWKYLIANYWDDFGFEPVRPMDLYRIVAWLGWVPNLLVALWIIRRKKQPLR